MHGFIAMVRVMRAALPRASKRAASHAPRYR
jgi:hypothetical protein